MTREQKTLLHAFVSATKENKAFKLNGYNKLDKQVQKDCGAYRCDTIADLSTILYIIENKLDYISETHYTTRKAKTHASIYKMPFKNKYFILINTGKPFLTKVYFFYDN